MTQLVRIHLINRDINKHLVGCGDTDDAAVQFVVSLAIFNICHSSVQVQRINSTEELARPPPPTCCLKHNANLMNHEHIL